MVGRQGPGEPDKAPVSDGGNGVRPGSVEVSANVQESQKRAQAGDPQLRHTNAGRVHLRNDIGRNLRDVDSLQGELLPVQLRDEETPSEASMAVDRLRIERTLSSEVLLVLVQQ